MHSRAVEGRNECREACAGSGLARGWRLVQRYGARALAWAETVTRVEETGVPDEEYDAAAAAFDCQQLADLTIAFGLMNAYNRMAISFRAPPSAAVP